MNAKASLCEHYRQLVGIKQPWRVEGVELRLEERRVNIRLKSKTGVKWPCPECGKRCSLYHHASERQWRHLDAMQCETRLIARVPRVECPTHGVLTASVPWAEKSSHWTLLFEAWAIVVLENAATVKAATKLLGISWHGAQDIMNRGVQRGMKRREKTAIKYLGVDEKSFLRAQSYVSVMSDIEGARVLEVRPERTQASAVELLETLEPEQKESVEAVAMDMSGPYQAAVSKTLSGAKIVHDRFHVARKVNEAIDRVRFQENKQLRKKGDKRLTGTKRLWMRGVGKMTRAQRREFKTLQAQNLKVSKARSMKEVLDHLWTYRQWGRAFTHLRQWHSWVMHSGLEPMKRVARTIRSHEHGVLNYTVHPITNAFSEGINSKIQSLKSAARGFRNFDHYRVRILFFCGKLNMHPAH